MANKTSNRYTDDDLNVSQGAFDKIVNQPDIQARNNQGDATIQDLNDSELNPRSATSRNGDDLLEAEKKNGEASRNNFNYQPPRQNTKNSSKGRFRITRKRAIGGGAVGGGILAIVLSIASISPFGAFIHFKEVASSWADRFNDTSYHIRMKSVYKTRYFNNKTCSGIGCKLYPSRISTKELGKLQEAGLKPIEENGRISHFEFDDGNGIQKISKDNFSAFYDNSPKFVAALDKATASPRAISWRGGQALKKFTFFGIDRSKLPSKIDDLRQSIYGNSSDTRRANGNTSDDTDKEKQKAENSAFSEAANGLNEEASALHTAALDGHIDPTSIPNPSSLTTNGAGSLAATAGSAGAKGLASGVLAAPDATCTAYRFTKALSFGAKAYQARDLIKYAGVIMVIADGAKEGKITAAEAALVGNLLMKPSTEKDSKGKTFSDSEGFQLITQGKVSGTSGIARFTNGTPAIEFFDKIINAAKSVGGDAGCKQVKSWYGQAGIFIGGLALNIGAVGACVTTGVGCAGLAANIGAGISFQLAASALIHYMEPTLIAYLAGTIAPDPANDPGGGYAAGNAIAAGMGAFGSQIGRANGLRPVTRDEYSSMLAETNNTESYLAQVNGVRDDGTKEYDINSISSRLATAFSPFMLALQSGNLPSAFAKFSSLASAAPSQLLSSVTPVSMAAPDTVDYYRSDLCGDEDYKDMNIATDAFCNPIYAESKEVLENYSPDSVLDYMLTHNYIDQESGEPLGEYLDYMQLCIDGSEPLIPGEKTASCTDDSEKTRYFRLYTMDKNIWEGIDSAVDDTLGQTSTENEAATSVGATSFTIATYNLLHGKDHYPDHCLSGESERDCITRRSGLQAKIITGEETDAELGDRKRNPAFDIVAMQEVSPFQFSELKRISGYDGFPLNGSGLSNCKDGSLAIIWNPAKFKMVDKGKAPAMSNVPRVCEGASRDSISAPWVSLESIATGQRLYIMSIHWPNESYFDPALGDNGTLRKAVGLARTWVQSKVGSGAPVFILGDFNDHYERANERVTYCGLTQGGLMQLSYDTMVGNDPNKQCPSAPSVKGIFDIDHIFATPVAGMTVTNSARMGPRDSNDGSILAKASDHTPVYATYSFAGNEGSGSFDGAKSPTGWVWPLQKNLNPGPCYGGAIQHAGMDINSSTNNNTVFAMHDGVVERARTDSGAAGNYIMIKATGPGSIMNGKTIYYSFEHLKDGSIRVSDGQPVKAGQPLAIAGLTGNVEVRSSAAHLHVTTALSPTLGAYGALGDTFDPMKVLAAIPAPEGYKCY